MHTAALERHEVRVVRDYKPTSDIVVDKHKVLQVLINLISNAKYAMDGTRAPDRVLTLGIDPVNGSAIRISVSDCGVGIAPENMTRIFSLGFTTRDNGHGFGLHSGFLAARELGGELSVRSDGPGHGATFTLELPITPTNS
jgi:signal transduction histidine kinase